MISAPSLWDYGLLIMHNACIDNVAQPCIVILVNLLMCTVFLLITKGEQDEASGERADCVGDQEAAVVEEEKEMQSDEREGKVEERREEEEEEKMEEMKEEKNEAEEEKEENKMEGGEEEEMEEEKREAEEEDEMEGENEEETLNNTYTIELPEHLVDDPEDALSTSLSTSLYSGREASPGKSHTS